MAESVVKASYGPTFLEPLQEPIHGISAREAAQGVSQRSHLSGRILAEYHDKRVAVSSSLRLSGFCGCARPIAAASHGR